MNKTGDYTHHFTVAKRIEMFKDDLKDQISPSILVGRFHHLVRDIQREVTEIDISHMKQEQSWYGIEERIWQLRENIDIQRRFDFDALIYDIRKQAVAEAVSGKYQYLPIFKTTKEPMKTIDELKREIDELQNIAIGITAEIELMNSKNQHAQKRRDMVKSKIDGLKWVLNTKKDAD